MLLKRLLSLITKKNLNAKIRNVIIKEIDKLKFVSLARSSQNPGIICQKTNFKEIDHR